MYTPLTHHPPRAPTPPQASRSSPQLRSPHQSVLSTGSGSIASLRRMSASSGAPSETGSHWPRISGAEARSGNGFGTGKGKMQGNSASGVKEMEKTMNDLKKQNFDLKLALFHYEEATALSNQRESEQEVTHFKHLLDTAESKLLAAHDHISALEDAFRRLSACGHALPRVASVGTQTHPVVVHEVEGTFEQDRRMYEEDEAENRESEIELEIEDVDVESLEDQVRWLEEERESPLAFRDAEPGLGRERGYFGRSEEGEVRPNEVEAQEQVRALAAMDQAGFDRCLTGMEFDEAVKGERKTVEAEQEEEAVADNERLVQEQMNTTLGGRYFIEHHEGLLVATPNGDNLHGGNPEQAQDRPQESHLHANGRQTVMAWWREKQDASTTTDEDTSTEGEQATVARVFQIENRRSGSDGKSIEGSNQQGAWHDETTARPLRYRIERRTAVNVVPSVARRQEPHGDILKSGEYHSEARTPDATLNSLDQDLAMEDVRRDLERLRVCQIRRLYGQEIDPASEAELSLLISPPISVDDGGSVSLSTLCEGTTVDLDVPFDIADPVPSAGKGDEVLNMLEELEERAEGHNSKGVWALPGVMPHALRVGDGLEDLGVIPQVESDEKEKNDETIKGDVAEQKDNTPRKSSSWEGIFFAESEPVPSVSTSAPLLSSLASPSPSPSSSSSTSFSPRQSRNGSRSKLPRPVTVRPSPSVTSSSSSSSTVIMFVDHPRVGTAASPIVRSERAWSAEESTKTSRSTSPRSPVAGMRRGNSLGVIPSQLRRDGDHVPSGRVKKSGSLRGASNGRWGEEKVPTGVRVGAINGQGRTTVGERMGR